MCHFLPNYTTPAEELNWTKCFQGRKLSDQFHLVSIISNFGVFWKKSRKNSEIMIFNWSKRRFSHLFSSQSKIGVELWKDRQKSIFYGSEPPPRVKLSFEWHSKQNTTGKHNSKFQIVQYCTIHFSEIPNTTQQHNYSLTIVLCF